MDNRTSFDDMNYFVQVLAAIISPMLAIIDYSPDSSWTNSVDKALKNKLNLQISPTTMLFSDSLYRLEHNDVYNITRLAKFSNDLCKEINQTLESDYEISKKSQANYQPSFFDLHKSRHRQKIFLAQALSCICRGLSNYIGSILTDLNHAETQAATKNLPALQLLLPHLLQFAYVTRQLSLLNRQIDNKGGVLGQLFQRFLAKISENSDSLLARIKEYPAAIYEIASRCSTAQDMKLAEEKLAKILIERNLNMTNFYANKFHMNDPGYLIENLGHSIFGVQLTRIYADLAGRKFSAVDVELTVDVIKSVIRNELITHFLELIPRWEIDCLIALRVSELFRHSRNKELSSWIDKQLAKVGRITLDETDSIKQQTLFKKFSIDQNKIINAAAPEAYQLLITALQGVINLPVNDAISRNPGLGEANGYDISMAQDGLGRIKNAEDTYSQISHHNYSNSLKKSNEHLQPHERVAYFNWHNFLQTQISHLIDQWQVVDDYFVKPPEEIKSPAQQLCQQAYTFATEFDSFFDSLPVAQILNDNVAITLPECQPTTAPTSEKITDDLTHLSYRQPPIAYVRQI